MNGFIWLGGLWTTFFLVLWLVQPVADGRLKYQTFFQRKRKAWETLCADHHRLARASRKKQTVVLVDDSRCTICKRKKS